MSASRNLLLPASRLLSAAASSSRAGNASRALSTSSVHNAITKFTMPAMSPTMTSGGIATWKVKEGQAFAAGDVLLEIETDKATMDVEAQDDGVMAKIIVQDGAKDVEVGKTIAMLAEEGDDISNVEVPKEEEAASAPKSASPEGSSNQADVTSDKSDPEPSTQTAASTGKAAPSTPDSSSSNAHHEFKGPLFPSVQRLIAENDIQDAENKIKGTGVRGMITKGDVLAFLGKAKSPTGSFKEPKGGIAVLGPNQAFPKGAAASSGIPAKAAPQEPLTGDALRSLILGGLAVSSRAARTKPAPSVAPAQIFAQQAEPTFASTPAHAPAPTPAPVRSGVTRKEGIRSDDPLWDLI